MIGLGCIAWSVGNCALPLFGWAIARWKWIKVVCTVPAMIMYLTYFITPESPRWLVSQGRMEDAKEVLTKIAKTNGSKVPEDIEVKLVCPEWGRAPGTPKQNPDVSGVRAGRG